jgi:hypothetical protein
LDDISSLMFSQRIAATSRKKLDKSRKPLGTFSVLAMTVIDSFLIGNSSRELLAFHEQID